MLPGVSRPLLIFLALFTTLTAEEVDLTIVEKWLAKHRGARSLHLEFNETRRLAALKNPLRTKGSMWLDFPTRRFRWQSGDPPKTIVISDGKRLVIAQPQRQRVEYKPAGTKGSSGPASLAALAEGFPSSVAEFQRKYRILSTEPDEKFHRIRTRPLRGQAARGLAQLTFLVDRHDFVLRGYRATLKDGSTTLYEFTRIVRNSGFPAGTFVFDDSGYQVTGTRRR